MWKKKLLIIAGIITGTALLGVLGVFFYKSKEYFANQFGRNTYISNTNVSSMTVDEAVEVMNESKGFSVEFSKTERFMKLIFPLRSGGNFQKTRL